MAETTPAQADASATATATRPTKPDEALFQKALEKAEKEHKDVMIRFNAVKAQIELVHPNKGKDGEQSATQKRRQELIAQLNDIRQKQAGGKSARSSKLDQIKRLDEQLRSRANELKAARSKVPFKSSEDLDQHIQRLEEQVGTGLMKLVDEKKALAEVTNLKKMRKNFAQFDAQEKQIADLKASIKKIKDTMDDPEDKALRERYNTIQGELDQIKAEQDGVFKNLSSLQDERSRLHTEQREKFGTIRKIKDEYYGQKKAFAAFEREARQKVWERRQAERERIDRERKKERAQRLLAEASDPAYLDEIRRARSLLHFFDPSSHQVQSPTAIAAATPATALSAQATRKVDDAGLKGTRLVRKEEREDFYLPAKKVGKKGRKGEDATDGPSRVTSSSKGFNVPPSVIEDCASMGLNPPTGAADVPTVIEQIKVKLAHWEADQTAQTQRNVEKAKKEIEKLEKEEQEGEAAAHSNGVNGKKKAAGDDAKAVAETTTDMNNASLTTSEGGKTTDETAKVGESDEKSA